MEGVHHDVGVRGVRGGSVVHVLEAEVEGSSALLVVGSERVIGVHLSLQGKVGVQPFRPALAALRFARRRVDEVARVALSRGVAVVHVASLVWLRHGRRQTERVASVGVVLEAVLADEKHFVPRGDDVVAGVSVVGVFKLELQNEGRV